MADKPKFDPSKPFEAVKPKFDPSQPYEAPEPQQDDSFLMKAGKNVLGFAQGASEVLNPAAIPHGIETLARTAITSLNPRNKGLAATLQESSQEAWIPKGNVGQLAAGARTLARMPVNMDKPIAEIYNQEIASQKAYEDALPEGAKKAGEYTAMAVSLGSALKDVGRGAKLAPAAERAANKSAVLSLKPSGAVGKKLLTNERRVEQLGKTLRDEKIVTAGASYKDILKRTAEKLDNYGEEIGHFSKSADAAIARDSSIRGISVADVAKRAENSIIPELIQNGKADVAKQVSDWVSGNLKAAAGEAGEIGFKQMQNIKTTLAKTKGKFDAARDTNSSEAFQDLWNVLNDAHEEGISVALSKAGSADDIKSFMKAKETYRDLKDAEKYIKETVGRMDANRAISPSDYFAGGSALVGGAATAGVPGAALAIPAAIANRVIRTRGNQLATGFYGSVANQLKEPIRKIPAIGAGIGAANTLIPDGR
jgi:hypothetical protein